jgi:hypothetical protein
MHNTSNDGTKHEGSMVGGLGIILCDNSSACSWTACCEFSDIRLS